MLSFVIITRTLVYQAKVVFNLFDLKQVKLLLANACTIAVVRYDGKTAPSVKMQTLQLASMYACTEMQTKTHL